MLTRAYAMLEVRSASEAGDERVFEGWATTPTTDRMGDVVDPLGAKFRNPLPLLHQHDADRPIGVVTLKKATANGIEFVARMPKITEPGPLKDRVDTAWGEIKAGLVRAVSIGFTVLKGGVEALADGLRFTAIEIVELSAVTVPANAQATITNIRSFDLGLAASGERPAVDSTRPASREIPQTRERKATAMPRTISEQIEDFTKTKATKVARIGDLMTKTGDKGETLDAAEAEEFETLRDELESIDKQLERLAFAERMQGATATPIAVRAVEAGRPEPVRAEPIVKAAERYAPGVRMARAARVIILSRLSMQPVEHLAREYYPNDPAIVDVVRAAVPAASTTNPTWAGALVGEAGAIVADFIEFLRPQTIIGRFGQGGIPDLTRVPFYTALIGQTSGGAGYWVGEGKAKPLTKFDFERKTLTPLKVANIAALTDEVIRSANPAVEPIIRDALVAALRERLDRDFVDPAKAAVAGVSPASITNGVVPIVSSGNDAEAVRADIKAAFAAYTANNNALAGGVWIAPSNLAAALGMMTNLLGQPEFGTVDRMGGTLGGFPVIPSDYVPADTIILANAPEIYLGDEGGFAVDMSREATLEMDSAPTASAVPPADATGSLVSMFQNNMVAIRAERTINWLKRRPEAVVMLSSVDWGDATGTTAGTAGIGDTVRSGRGADRV